MREIRLRDAEQLAQNHQLVNGTVEMWAILYTMAFNLIPLPAISPPKITIGGLKVLLHKDVAHGLRGE